MCDHTSYYACKAADCILYTTSPWVCVARYYEDYPIRDFEISQMQCYGSLRNHPDSCPRSKDSNRNAGEPKEGRPACVVHQMVMQRNLLKCQCDVWVTGCICGAFAKERKSENSGK